MDLHEKYHEETQRMPSVLLGVASAAIAFAFHQTASRDAAWSLLPILGAVLAWAGSFAAGVLYSQAIALAIKANLGLNAADAAQNAQWRTQAKAMFDDWNGRARRRYSAQQWWLLLGAVLYGAGHIWYIAERSAADVPRAATSATRQVVAPSPAATPSRPQP